MADKVPFFASILASFPTLWYGTISPDWAVNNRPGIVEAAIIPTSATTPLAEPQVIPDSLQEGLLAAIDNAVASFTPRHGPGSEPTEPVHAQFTIGQVPEDEKDCQRRSVNYDHPSRQTHCRQSTIDPFKARILDSTCGHVQDKALDVVKAVVMTPGTSFPLECSAQIEYYHSPIAEACSVQVEYFPGPAVEEFSAQVEHYPALLVHEACRAQVEYFNGYSGAQINGRKSGNGTLRMPLPHLCISCRNSTTPYVPDRTPSTSLFIGTDTHTSGCQNKAVEETAACSVEGMGYKGMMENIPIAPIVACLVCGRGLMPQQAVK